MASTDEAKIWGVMAASGSGKGLWIKQFLRTEKPARLVIWDYKNEYQEFAPTLVSNLEALRKAMLKAGGGPLRIRYKCKPGTDVKQTMREFEGVCRLVQAWQKCVFIAEELSNVTTPGWAPAAWREMSTGGRHELVHIIGVAQNPALIDKTFLSNCTLIHVGPLREYRHRQTVARSMDLPVQELTELVKFQWIERNNDTREVARGWSYPPGFVPTPTQPSPTPTGGAQAGQGAQGAGTLATKAGGAKVRQVPAKQPTRRKSK